MKQQRDAKDLHDPVLVDVCVQLLAPALESPGSVLIDGTLGMGGHSEAFLAAFPEATIVGIDRDPQALQIATRRLAGYGDRFIPVHATFDRIPSVAEEYGKDGKVDAVFLDLGVSSYQLDTPGRGFSYAQDGPLDMRMDPEEGQSVTELLAAAPRDELARILREYGEERFAKQIATAIVRSRESTPFTSTSQLADLVKEVVPAPARRRGGNPAKRTFQALRIAVNDELDLLSAAVPAALESLRIGGRLAVESYQSLEDRIVKRIFQEGIADTAPPRLPIIPETDLPRLRPLLKGALKAGPEEIAKNPRAQSVRLRAVELVSPWRKK